ncbi:MAG: hypothetical protein WDN10_00685 [bacterium]
MRIFLALVGLLFAIIGTVSGVGGVAEIISALTGSRPGAFWPGFGLLLLGVLLVAGGVLLFVPNIRPSSELVKRLLFAGLFVPVGGFLVWMSLGANGVLKALNLDQAGVFAYATPDPIFWVTGFYGAGTVIVGVSLLFSRRAVRFG